MSIRTDRTVRGDYHVAEVSRGHSSAGGNEIHGVGRTHPGEGLNGTTGEYLGKWSWLSKSVFLLVSCSPAAGGKILVALRSPRPNRIAALFGSVLTSRTAGYVTRMSGGVGGALSDGRLYPYRRTC